ncbi:dimethylaniline monooxygenase (N-oxide forming) [Microdochium nivale]|nr:dimethylaniline monooxygenase (N-oxide forming) [Microdochium nivale]
MTLCSDKPPLSESRHPEHHDKKPDNDNRAAAMFSVHKIAIIGAGPSGLAAAKYLLAEGDGIFKHIDIFEQRTEVGGVWKHTPWYSSPPSAVSSTSGSAVTRDTGWGEPGAGVSVAKGLEVPQTNALVDIDEPVFLPAPFDLQGRAGDDGGQGRTTAAGPFFPSPMYDELNTNIPHTLMQFSDHPFPRGCEIYPTRQVVQEYLVDYARDVRHLVRFATQVVDVSLVAGPSPSSSSSSSAAGGKWQVTSRDLLGSNTTMVSVYDAVVVASGHYATPYIPDVPGIREFHAAWPGVISHSKSYRAPDDPGYDCTSTGARKVVVVGNSASGLDIASQIRRARATAAAAAVAPVINSVQTATSDDMRRFVEEDQGSGAYDEAPPIARFLAEQKGVEFTDGRIELGVDRVLFATGYLYTFPFLKSLTAAAAFSVGGDAGPNGVVHDSSSSVKPLITDGSRVHNLARHLLHVDHPTLAFPGLPIKVIPFPLAEAQAAVLARLWSNALPLPPRAVLEAWEREPAEEVAAKVYTSNSSSSRTEKLDEDEEAARGRKRKAERGYHVFPTGGDGRYINEMHDWVTTGRWPASSFSSPSSAMAPAAAAVYVAEEDCRVDEESSAGNTNGTARKVRTAGKQPPYWDERLLWQRTIFAQARIAFERTGRTAKTLEELGFVFEDRDKKRGVAGAGADISLLPSLSSSSSGGHAGIGEKGQRARG